MAEFKSIPMPTSSFARDEVKHDPSNGQFASGGGSGGSGDPKDSHTPEQREAGKKAARQYFSKGASGKEIAALKKGKSGREYTDEELRKDYRTTSTGSVGSKGRWHPDVGHYTEK